MSDSSDCVQSALCGLIENVEAATSKVVDQRMLINIHTVTIVNSNILLKCAEHLAVAQEYRLKIGTFKPSMSVKPNCLIVIYYYLF